MSTTTTTTLPLKLFYSCRDTQFEMDPLPGSSNLRNCSSLNTINSSTRLKSAEDQVMRTTQSSSALLLSIQPPEKQQSCVRVITAGACAFKVGSYEDEGGSAFNGLERSTSTNKRDLSAFSDYLQGIRDREHVDNLQNNFLQNLDITAKDDSINGEQENGDSLLSDETFDLPFEFDDNRPPPEPSPTPSINMSAELVQSGSSDTNNDNSSGSESRRSSDAGMKKGALKIPSNKSSNKSIENMKSVVFADTAGHDLLSVVSFDDLKDWDPSKSASPDLNPKPTIEQVFAPLFLLPLGNLSLIQSIRERKVGLESVTLKGSLVLGSVLVANISFCKDVAVRYTLDDWETSKECGTHHVSGAGGGCCDRFAFEILFNVSLIRDRVMFCVRYKCAAGEFWDNNYGANYVLKLLNPPS